MFPHIVFGLTFVTIVITITWMNLDSIKNSVERVHVVCNPTTIFRVGSNVHIQYMEDVHRFQVAVNESREFATKELKRQQDKQYNKYVLNLGESPC